MKEVTAATRMDVDVCVVASRVVDGVCMCACVRVCVFVCTVVRVCLLRDSR